MSEIGQLKRILAVRETKRAAARLLLGEAVARAADAHAVHRSAVADAEATRFQGLDLLARQRDEILGAAFKGDRIGEYRQSSHNVDARITAADATAAEAGEIAAEAEQVRADTARKLLSLDGRCSGLKKKLRELHTELLNKIDEKIAEDFTAIQVNESVPCNPLPGERSPA